MACYLPVCEILSIVLLYHMFRFNGNDLRKGLRGVTPPLSIAILTRRYYGTVDLSPCPAPENTINNPIPIINKAIPAQEVISRSSPTRKTPSNDAVNGSASESVTAVDEGTYRSPPAKSRYAAPVAISPR